MNIRLISNHFGDSVSGPEKAGVGGSIPSPATIFSSTYMSVIHSNTFQNLTACRGLSCFCEHDLSRFSMTTCVGTGRTLSASDLAGLFVEKAINLLSGERDGPRP